MLTYIWFAVWVVAAACCGYLAARRESDDSNGGVFYGLGAVSAIFSLYTGSDFLLISGWDWLDSTLPQAGTMVHFGTAGFLMLIALVGWFLALLGLGVTIADKVSAWEKRQQIEALSRDKGIEGHYAANERLSGL